MDDMATMRVTVSQFREMRGLKNQVAANSIMNLLKATGNAVAVGKAKAKGRGKPSIVYEIPQVATIQLFETSEIVETETEDTGEAVAV